VLIQLLWSYYALWQFWFLSRSKTLGWSHTARFFVIGAWVTAPLSALIVWSVHGLGEGEAELTIHDEWSSAIFGPLVEETVKLLPLLLLLLLSRRVRSFSLTDYLLVGAATGTGFDFLEEVVRTWSIHIRPADCSDFSTKLSAPPNWSGKSTPCSRAISGTAMSLPPATTCGPPSSP